MREVSVIGIDPGLSGAISFYRYSMHNYSYIKVFDLPTVEKPGKAKIKKKINSTRLSYLIKENIGKENFAFIENVATMSNQGVASNGSLMHTLGVLEGVMAGLDIPYELIAPMKWKKFYQLIKEDKKKSLNTARTLFSELDLKLEKHHNRAEAALIAYFGFKSLNL